MINEINSTDFWYFDGLSFSKQRRRWNFFFYMNFDINYFCECEKSKLAAKYCPKFRNK